MKFVPSWLSYSVYRILLFAVPLAVLLMLSIVWWVSAIVAALIGLCLSYIFLRTPREKVALDLYTARHPAAEVVHPDAESEDAAIDRATEAAEAAEAAHAADAAGRAGIPAEASVASEREGGAQ